MVEVSSFQLETTDTFHPWIAALLNLTPDHLDRHADFEEYAAAKARIFARQTRDDWAVANADDPRALELAQPRARASACASRASGRSTPGVTISDGNVVERGPDDEIPIAARPQTCG